MKFEQLRAKYPDYTDEEILTGLQATKYQGLSRGQIEKELGYDPPDFTRGAKIAFGQTPALLKGAVGLVGATAEKFVGEDGIATGFKNWGLRGYQEGMGKLAPLQRDTDSLTNAWARAQEGDLGALVDFAQFGLGYGLGQLGEAAASAVIGGIAGSAMAPGPGTATGAVTGVVAKGAVKQAATGMVEKAVAKRAAEIAEQLAAQGVKDVAPEQMRAMAVKSVAKDIGSTAGLVGLNTGKTAGGIYGSAEEEAAANGEQLSGGDLARVWGASLASGGVESLMDKLQLGAVTGKVKLPGVGGRAARATTGTLMGATAEGLTEAVQTGIERYGAGKDLTGEDALREYVDSAGLGAVGGGAIGGFSGAVHRPKPSEKLNAQADEADKQADQQRAEAEADLERSMSPDASLEDTIAAAEKLVNRPSAAADFTAQGISQRIAEELESEAYQAADAARLGKLQEAVDLHVELQDHAMRQANETARAVADANVAEQLATDLPGRTTSATEQDLMTPALRLSQERAATAAQFTGLAAADRAGLDSQRQAAGLAPAADSLSSMPTNAPDVRQPGRLLPGITVPEGVDRPNLKIIGNDGATPLEGVGPNRAQPITASSPGRQDTSEFVELRGMTREQAEQRLAIIKAERVKGTSSLPTQPAELTEIYDATPLRPGRYAEKTLALARENVAEAGVDPKRLVLVPHPAQPLRMAIGISPIKMPAPARGPVESNPDTLSVVPHPNGKPGVYAIKRIKSAPYSPELQGNKREAPPSTDEVDLYVSAMRKTNTPAARAFVQEFDAGRLTRQDVMRAMVAERRTQNTVDQNVTSAAGFSRAQDPRIKPRGDAETDGRMNDRGAGIGESWQDKQKLGDLGKMPAGKDAEAKQPDTNTDGRGDTGPAREPGVDPGWTEEAPKGRKPLGKRETADALATQDNNAELMKAWQARDLDKVLSILEKAHSPTIRRGAQMARKLVGEMKIAEWPRSNKVRGQFMNPDRVGGFYDPVHDTLHMRPGMDRKNNTPVRSMEGNEHVILHEIMHGIMHQALMAPTAAQQPFVTRMEALFKFVKRELKGHSDYGLSDIHEFVSEAWSNPRFQTKLAGIKYGKQSAWSKFVDFIAGLLGTKDKTALTAVLQLSEEIAAQPRDRNQYTKRSQMGPVRAASDVAAGERIADLVREAQGRKDGNKAFVVYRPLDKSRAELLQEATGLDLSGYAHGVDEAAIRHILRRHGEGGEELRGMPPITVEDLKRLPELTDPTRARAVVRVEDSPSGLARISYETELDGDVFVVEEVRQGRKRLALVTMYRKARAAPGASPEGAVPPTSETFGAQPGRSVADDPMAPKAVELTPDEHAEQLAPGTRRYTPEQSAGIEQAFGKPDNRTQKQRFIDGARELRQGFRDRFITGVVDQFHALKKFSPRGYRLARLAAGAYGALEAAMVYGRLRLEGGSTTVDMTGGFANVLADLKGEDKDFFRWVVGMRGDELAKLGKENLMSEATREALKSLATGKMADGRDRAQVYGDALARFIEFNDSILAVTRDSGLIDQAAYDLYAGMPYVPFYRIVEKGVQGSKFSEALTNQYAWKQLKGGTELLNDNLLENVLRNWSHLISASAKNRAAEATIKDALEAGIAEQVPQGTEGAVKIMVDGKATYYAIHDEAIHEAMTAMHYLPPDSAVMKGLTTMKRWLTLGVTTLPDFKIRNLIRDSMQAVAVAELHPNVFKNLADGAEALDVKGALKNLGRTLTPGMKNPASFLPMNQTYAEMLASGALMRFGAANDGDQASHAQKLIRRAGGVMLDKKGLARLLQVSGDVLEAYQELGDRGEQANRAALYQQMIARGYSKEEAAFAARDLLDFSLQGKMPLVRFLVQTVPFLNARIQGLYKLGRGGVENPKRMAAAVSAVVMASMALYMLGSDEPEWKEREDWDRDSFWWFKIGGTAFRVPKPFELGAAGTLAERTWELMVEPEMDGRRYTDRISAMLFQTFAFDPTPQALKPLVDVYANKDSFKGSPIETRAMQNMRPEDRYNENTSELAKFLGSLGLPTPLALVRGQWGPNSSEGKMSPQQVDYLIRGYFGTLGAFLVGITDAPATALGGRGERPDWSVKRWTGGFVDTLPADQSRYVGAVYDKANEIGQLMQSYRQALASGDKDKALEIMAEDGDKLAKYKASTAATKQLSTIAKQIKKVSEDKGLDGAEKREKLKELYAKRNDRAEALAKTLVTE